MIVRVKITAVVKVGGVWRKPGDVVEGVKPEVAQEIVAKRAGEIVEETAEKPPKPPKSKTGKDSDK